MVPQEKREGHELPLTGTITWNDVIYWATHGNPTPFRRAETTEEEWRQVLTDEQFHITRLKGTARANSSEMCRVFEAGRYECLCCGTELFGETSEYQSHTGWLSFTQPIVSGVIAYHWDGRHGMRRIEVTCNVCDAHLGHVFPDGQEPNGLRFCINAVSLHEVVMPSSSKVKSM